MKFPDDQLLLLRVHIEKHWLRGCPMCGNKSWTASGFTMVSLSETSNQTTIGGPGLPCIPVTCTVCGNTVFVNGIVAGVVPKIPDPETP